KAPAQGRKARASFATRGEDPGARCRRQDERPGWSRDVPRRKDGEELRLEHPGEARGGASRRGRRLPRPPLSRANVLIPRQVHIAVYVLVSPARWTYAGNYLHNELMAEDDAVFRALADATRRELLDRLRERNGQTLGELCEGLEMARQSATQHLDVLEAANLISTVRRGREKLHYLNPVPLWTMQERWIERFERRRLRTLSAIKERAEEDTMDERPSYVYVTYIKSSPERVWEALTDANLTAEYWGHSNVSDWRVGSNWE